MSTSPRQNLIEEAYGAIEALHRCSMPNKEKVMADLKLDRRQARTLWYLQHHDHVTIGEVAVWHDISKSLATQLIEGLVERDLVSREGDAEDRRIVVVKLAPGGKRLLKEFRAMLLSNMQQQLETLTDTELAAVSNIGKKLTKEN